MKCLEKLTLKVLFGVLVVFAGAVVWSCSGDDEEEEVVEQIEDSKWLSGGEFVVLIDSYYPLEDTSYFLTVQYHDRWPAIHLVREMHKKPTNLFVVDDKLMTLNSDGYMGVVDKEYTLVWSNFNASPYDMNAIASGDGQVVAVGDEGRILFKSGDVGSEGGWSLRRVTRVNLRTVIYGEGIFVAAGEDGFVFISEDKGHTWTQLENLLFEELDDAIDTEVDNPFLNAGIYADGSYILVGDNTDVLISSDAKNWVSVPLPSVLSNVDLIDISYGNGLFVAVGGVRPPPPDAAPGAAVTDTSSRLTSLAAGSTETRVAPNLIMVSSNGGKTWVEKDTDDLGVGWFMSVDYREGNTKIAGSGRYTLRRPLFLAVGSDSLMAYSTNGDKWTNMGLSTLLENIPADDVPANQTVVDPPYFNGITNLYRDSGTEGSSSHTFRAVRVYR